MSAITTVQIYADGTAVGQATIAKPVGLSRHWTLSTSAPAGTHTIVACARTAQGVTARVSLTFTVTQPDPTATVLAPDVVTLSATDLASVVSSCATNVTFSRRPNVAVGQVIVAGVTPKLPGGLMRRVTAIKSVHGKIEVDTVPAALDEVFWQANIEVHDAPVTPPATTTAAPSAGPNAAPSPNATRSPNATISTPTLSFSQTFAISASTPGAHVTGDVELSAGLSASLRASMDFILHITTDWSWTHLPTVTVSEFLWRITGSLTIGVNVKLSGGGTIEFEIPNILPSIRLAPIPVSVIPPVAIAPVVSMDLGISVSVEKDIEFGADGTANLSAGVEYTDGAFHNISNGTTNGEITTPAKGGSKSTGTLQIYAKPKLAALIDLLAGPDIDMKIGVEFSAEKPCPGKVAVGLFLDVEIGGEFHFFKIHLEYTAKLIGLEVELADEDFFVCELKIKTDELPDGEVGQFYSADVEAEGGTKPYTWEAPDLPDGLHITDEGHISGTPTEGGDFEVEFDVEDSPDETGQVSDVVTKTIELNITGGLRVATTSLPDGTVDIGYGTTLQAVHGTGNLTWSLETGHLPAGLTLNPDGTISGTPAAEGTEDITVLVTDEDGNTADADLTLHVNPKLPDPVNGDPQTPDPTPPCVGACGTSWGDPHLTTFDGARYDFQQVGEYIALKSTVDDMQIQVRQRPWTDSRTVAVNCAVAFEVAGHRVGIYLNDDGSTRTLVDGSPVTPGTTPLALPGGGSITQSTPTVATVRWNDGSFVTVDSAARTYLGLSLSLSADEQGHVVGLFGNADGNSGNDLRTRDGVALPDPATTADLYGDFSQGWRVHQAESLFDYASGEDTTTFTDLAFPYGYISVADLPDDNRAAAIAACNAAGIVDEPMLDDCVLDVALTGNIDAATAAAVAKQAVNPTPIGTTCNATDVAANDDGSSPEITLPFSVNFYGQQFHSLWVNNNGNITFDGPLSAFTPSDLSTTGSAIVAGWWADVDTRGASSQPVRYGSGTVDGRTAFCVTYDDVGYFAAHDDKLNSFQIYIVDRSDVAPGAFDIVLKYQKLLWETGDASGGTGGLGGTSATVGYSNGTGATGTFFEMPGSRVPGSFLDGAPGSLVTGDHNTRNEAGAYVYEIRQ